jgi:restriction system protein
MLPKQKDIEIPLLEVLVEIGGEGRPKEIYPLVTAKFPEVPREDFLEQISRGMNKWTNRIQWVRQRLIDKGEIHSPRRGIWTITEAGRMRIKTPEISAVEEQNFEELYQDYETAIKSRLLDNLNNLSPRQFEAFAKKLMEAYGFVDVEITDVGPDGGIDGYGKLRLGLATINAAFQCKRWKGNVGRTEVDKFRGAIQGEYEQGVFFTTSEFTSQAKEASIRKGAVPVILLNGSSIVDIMIDKELGVRAQPIYIYQPTLTDFEID